MDALSPLAKALLVLLAYCVGVFLGLMHKNRKAKRKPPTPPKIKVKL